MAIWTTAAQHLQRSQELGEHTGLPQNPYRWRVAMARIREAQGDLAGALTLLDEAQRVYLGDFSPNVRPVPALRARVLAAQGKVGDALGWAREQGLSVDDNLTYIREFEHITLAKVLLAHYATDGDRNSLHGATGLLQRLLSAADAGGRTGSVIEILVLQALAHHAGGDTPGALAPLERALTLAEPEGYVRVFVGEGPPMASLLTAVARLRAGWDYVRRLLAACADDDVPSPRQPPSNGHPRQPGSRRAAERTRAGCAATVGHRPGRAGHRATALRVREHHAHPHQEHLRQARREQPTGSGPPRRGTGPALPHPRPLIRPGAEIASSPHRNRRGHHINHQTW